MIRSKHDTTPELKEKHFKTFMKLVEDQFLYGAKKYAASDLREATDIIVDEFGIDWVLGTMKKYLSRFKNTTREKDLLKIGCYCYIIWLKMGYWENKEHDTDTWNEQKGEKDGAKKS